MVKKWRYVYSFRQNRPTRTSQTTRRTDRHRATA